MSLLHLKLEATTEADLQRLVDEGISESKTLEYKLVLEIATDDQKREWLSDVTALANTDGGDLIFGRDHLLTDEILIKSEDQDLARALRPAFDQVWNACGLAGSPNYNEAGDWEPRN